MKRIAIQIETTELCSYGCGETAKFLNGSKNLMCQTRCNRCPAVRKKNSANPGKRTEKKNQKWLDAMAAKKGTTAKNQYSKAKELGLEKPVLSEEVRLRMSEASKKRRHSQETKELISQKALASKHRRLKRGIVMYLT